MNATEESKEYKSLTNRMATILIVVAITPMMLVSGFILEQYRVSYSDKIHAHLGELVLKHKQNIDGFLLEKLSDLRFMAAAFDMEQLSEEQFLRDRLTDLRREYGTVFGDLGVIDESGRQIAYAGPFKLSDADYSDAEWFKIAIRSDYYISNVFMGLRGEPHFIISVLNESAEGKWILRATIDFLLFNSIVENLRMGKTGVAYILNQHGELQTKTPFEPEKSRKKAIYEMLKAADHPHSGIRIIEKKDEDGTERIYVGAFLKNEQWLLVFRQEVSDAFSELYNTQKIAFALIFLGSLGIMLTAFVFARRMISQIMLVDREKEMMNRQVIETGKLASIGELAAGIAHEINNPVAIMVEEAGWIEDLLEEEDLKQAENLEEFQRSLKQIHTQGIRCKEITHKLLSFARKTDSRIQNIDVNELVQEVVELSGQKAKYEKVRMTVHPAEGLPLITASHTEVQQVLLNLINNALYALEKKGDLGHIDIYTRHENGNVVVEVADDGPGIPAINLSRIFDPFFTTKPVGKGTGLGLSICYGIIKKMGGDIDVRSVVDDGTVFTIRIPARKKEGENTESLRVEPVS